MVPPPVEKAKKVNTKNLVFLLSFFYYKKSLNVTPTFWDNPVSNCP